MATDYPGIWLLVLAGMIRQVGSTCGCCDDDVHLFKSLTYQRVNILYTLTARGAREDGIEGGLRDASVRYEVWAKAENRRG